ncbi:carbohydrate ABC transporter permease [Salinarimonas ramus]|uniref:Glycerol-3-phosphate ABC transporter permease n=1 Tax=Salinarimonas ramus TaxID=690164 RepID=A0A917Q5A2_9HYPH|nr:sugar ABC transporter permease [Salinarimonas ramus]GGK25399.1 glycerol-3-phosphate ABC transporter permease [Salinarimonas ramus]
MRGAHGGSLQTAGLVAPAFFAVAVFLYLPIAASGLLAVLDYHPATRAFSYAGLANIEAVWRDPAFRVAAWNTLVYCLVLVPAQVVVPLLLALGLREIAGSRLAPVYYACLFAPTLVSFSVAGAVWLPLLNPINGVLNEMLIAIGLPPSRWHTDARAALWVVCVVTFWKTFGLNLVLWYAALMTIPREQIEAARIDGAGFFRRVRDIDIPLASPTAFFILVTTVFTTLDDIVGIIDVLTGGGPFERTTNLPYLLWQKGLVFFQFGQASVVALVTIAIVALLTFVQFRFVERRVTYA